MGRPSRRPTAIQAALRRRRAGDVRLGRCSKVWMRSNWMRWSIRRGTARLTDRRPQFAKLADERQSLERLRRRNWSVILASIRGFASRALALRSTAASQSGAQPRPRHAVEAAWAAAKAAGPPRAFFIRIRARRGDQVAAVAVARKLAVLCWHCSPSRATTSRRAQLWWPIRSAASNCKPGNRRRLAYAYNVKALRTQEMTIAEQAEGPYEQFVSRWRLRRPGRGVRERLKPARHE
jgi:hypothetical protein